jgi:hypothetical protein
MRRVQGTKALRTTKTVRVILVATAEARARTVVYASGLLNSILTSISFCESEVLELQKYSWWDIRTQFLFSEVNGKTQNTLKPT